LKKYALKKDSGFQNPFFYVLIDFLKRDTIMKKSNKVFNLSTIIFLFASFAFMPMNIAFAADSASGSAADSGKGKDGGKGKDDEEPECE